MKDAMQGTMEEWTPQQFLQMQASLINLAHDAILVRDPASRVIFWNHGAAALYGIKAEDAVGQVTHVLLQTRFPVSATAVDDALEHQGNWEGELIHTRADGTQVIVESHQVLMRDEQNRPYVILEVNRDITAQKEEMARIVADADLARRQAQTLLEQSAQRLRLAQRAGNIGTFERDLARQTMIWTPELEELYGLAPGSFNGTHEDWIQHVHPDDRARVEENLRLALGGGPPYHVEFRICWPDGTIRWLMAKGEITSYDDAGRPLRMLGVSIDITRLKETEQLLQQLNTNLEERVAERTLSLEQLNKELQRSNQELQDFAYVASHDLQEPLRKIQAFGNLLQEEYGHALGEGREYVERMRQAAGRMRVLIDDLLMFSRVTTHASPFQVVDLHTIVRDVLADLEIQIQNTGGTVLVESLPVLEADASQMRQLFQNLLGNALKFHRRDVPPVVRVFYELLHDPEGEGGVRCCLCVEDNGIGFDEKYLDRIFTVFQRLHGKNAYEGTGIGLAVVRKIAERHGGSVTARSHMGQGSTFVVTLPAQRIVKE
jgi:PAS domain S-box-containing protein